MVGGVKRVDIKLGVAPVPHKKNRLTKSSGCDSTGACGQWVRTCVSRVGASWTLPSYPLPIGGATTSTPLGHAPISEVLARPVCYPITGPAESVDTIAQVEIRGKEGKRRIVRDAGIRRRFRFVVCVWVRFSAVVNKFCAIAAHYERICFTRPCISLSCPGANRCATRLVVCHRPGWGRRP